MRIGQRARLLLVRSEFEASLPPPPQAEFVSLLRRSGLGPGTGGPYGYETIYYRSSSDHSVIADYYRNLIEPHGWEVTEVRSDLGILTQPKGERYWQRFRPWNPRLDLIFQPTERFMFYPRLPSSSFTYYLESGDLRSAVRAMRRE